MRLTRGRTMNQHIVAVGLKATEFDVVQDLFDVLVENARNPQRWIGDLFVDTFTTPVFMG